MPLDSFDIVFLLGEIYERFGLAIPAGQIRPAQFATPRRMAAFLLERGRREAGA